MKNKIIFITENKDNNLMKISSKLNADIIEHKDFIGGRYSVLSEAGMFPAALMGLKVLKFKNFEKLINFKAKLIDLESPGLCPYEEDSFVLCYNGEIYNYIELRADLQKQGFFSVGFDRLE